MTPPTLHEIIKGAVEQLSEIDRDAGRTVIYASDFDKLATAIESALLASDWKEGWRVKVARTLFYQLDQRGPEITFANAPDRERYLNAADVVITMHFPTASDAPTPR